MSNCKRETLAGVLLSCYIILYSLCWIIRRNSLASFVDTSFLLDPSFFSANLPAGMSSSGAGVALLADSSTSLAFPLVFAGCASKLGAARMRPLWVMPLNLVMLVTFAESESMSVVSPFLSHELWGHTSTGPPCCFCKERGQVHCRVPWECLGAV